MTCSNENSKTRMVGGCELLQDVTSFAYNSYTASKKTRRESRPKAALRNGDHLDFVCLHGVPGNARQEQRICLVVFQSSFLHQCKLQQRTNETIPTPRRMTRPPKLLPALKNNGCWRILYTTLGALLGMCSPPGALTTLKPGKRLSEIRRMVSGVSG